MPQLIIKTAAKPMTDIFDTAKAMIRLAQLTQQCVSTEFNGIELMVTADDEPGFIMGKYHAECLKRNPR